MSIDSRLQDIEHRLAMTGTSAEPVKRITINRRACAEAFDAFAAQGPVDRRTFEDFSECMEAFEAQRNGATK